MRMHYIFGGMAWLLMITGCASTQNDAMLSELRDIKASLGRIENDIAEGRKEAAKPLPMLSSSSFSSRKANPRELSKIKLPENPTQEQVREYIRDIQLATKGQNSFSNSDPQVAMLTRVGSENIPLLIAALSLGSGTSSYHLRYAIINLADGSNKAVILEALPIYHELVSAVVNRGWVKDARDILLMELKVSGQRLPTEWIQTVALMNDEESYPLLREYFINASNRSSTYKAICYLPIEDLDGAVAEAWERSRSDQEYERTSMAMIAAEYGHLDALTVLIEGLPYGSISEYRISDARGAIMKSTDFRGSNDELAEWFKLNKDQLTFDLKTKKFVVGKDA